MKIAIAGKGGTGKTFITAGLARIFSETSGAARIYSNYAGSNAGHAAARIYSNDVGSDAGHAAARIYSNNAGSDAGHAAARVYALDADPAGGLGAALGLSPKAVGETKPIADMGSFIRTGEEDGALYLSSLDAGDPAGQYSTQINNVNFLRLAGLKRAGAGGYEREFAFLHALINSMTIEPSDIMLLDMCAGVEPLTRGAVKGADALLIVAEATRACIEVARVIRTLGAGLGVRHIHIVANKIKSEKEEVLIRANFTRGELIGLVRMTDGAADPRGLNKTNSDLKELANNIRSVCTSN